MRYIRHILFFPILTFFCGSLLSQQDSLLSRAIMVKAVFQKYHYDPAVLNDDFSAKAFILFRTMLDPRDHYFLMPDIEQLKKYENTIDEFLNGKPSDMIPVVTKLYKERLQGALRKIEEISAVPFDFTADESIRLYTNDTILFSADEKGFHRRWYKWLKLQTLSNLEKYGRDSVTKKIDPGKEPEMRKKAALAEQRMIRRILNHPGGFEAYVQKLFLNAVTMTYDLHSLYMTQAEHDNYVSGDSPETLSFGIVFNESSDGSILVERVVPGGPAWKSNMIHKGDVLVQIRWEGKEAIDCSGSTLEDLAPVLRMSNTAKMEFIFKNANGQTNELSLVKEKVKDEENIVRSFLLKGEKKVGYISLPGFYRDMSEQNKFGCASDVAREILKLQREPIEGLILDLRYNPGGAMEEAVELAGIFLDDGPMSVYKSRNDKPRIIPDMRRGTLYAGPLVVLVNGQSASASELVSATLQDYHRAIIAGSNTFGKGTAQTIIPLDSTININDPSFSMDLVSANGYVVVTVGKFYRVSGRSTQRSGVKPDVGIPEYHAGGSYHEMDFQNVFAADTLKKKILFTALPALPVQELSELSHKRIAEKSSFRCIAVLNDSLAQRSGKHGYSIPLNVRKYDKWAQWQNTLTDSIGNNKPTTVYEVINTTFDREVLRIDSFERDINKMVIGNISTDDELEEAYYIISDLINKQNK